MKRTLVDADGFRRVHRLTPLLRFWSLIVAIVALQAFNLNASMLADVASYLRHGHLGEVGWGTLIGLGVFVALCAVIWLVSEVWWRKLGFRLGQEEVALRHGVLTTAYRSARYERIQAVDVVESVIARLFGLAAVRVETAGGRSSVIEIGYVRKAEAEKLRSELLHRVRGAADAAPAAVPGEPDALAAAKPDAETGPAPAAETGAAPGAGLIPEIPIQRTLLSNALRIPTLVLVVAVAALLIVPVSRAMVLPILFGMVTGVWNLIDTSWRFSARLESQRGPGTEVLHISYGLADRRRQAIRLTRIHGVRVMQPLLWRFFGWYEVQVSVAGYGTAGGGKKSGSTRILPVGSREQALALLTLVSDLSPEQVEQVARPEGATTPTYTSPPRARWVSPVDWAQQAVTLVEHPHQVAVVHSGRLNRRVCVVSTPHIQELTLVARPLGQVLKLNDVRFDLVTGPVKMAGAELAPADARELLERLRRRTLPPLTPVAPEGDSGR